MPWRLSYSHSRRALGSRFDGVVCASFGCGAHAVIVDSYKSGIWHARFVFMLFSVPVALSEACVVTSQLNVS